EEAREALDKAIGVAPASFEMYVRKRVPWMRPEDYTHMRRVSARPAGKAELLPAPFATGSGLSQPDRPRESASKLTSARITRGLWACRTSMTRRTCSAITRTLGCQCKDLNGTADISGGLWMGGSTLP